MHKYFIFVSLFVLLLGCDSEKGAPMVTIDGFEDSGTTRRAPSVNVRFIHLSDDVPIDLIHNVFILNDHLIVLTNKGVFRYDMEGNFIQEISHKGRAENEWTTVGPLTIDRSSGTLNIYDTSSKKVLRYSETGDYLGSSPIPDRLFTVHQAECLDDGRVVFAHGIINDSGVLYSIEDSNYHTLTTVNTVISTKGACEKIGKHPLSVYGNDVKVLLPFDNKVYRLEGDKLTPCFILNTSKKVLPKSRLKKIDDYSFNEYKKLMENGFYVGPNNIFENSKHLLLSFFDNDFILIDKESGEASTFSLQLGNRLDYFPPTGLLNTSSDYFVGVIDVLKANSISGFIADDCDDESLLKLKEIASAPLNSNPFVLLYKF